jgi:hypothetical protein
MDRREATAEGAQAQSMRREQPNARRDFLFIPEFIQQESTRQMLEFSGLSREAICIAPQVWQTP